MEIDYAIVENAMKTYDYVLKSQFLALAKYFVNLKLTPTKRNSCNNIFELNINDNKIEIYRNYNKARFEITYHKVGEINYIDEMKYIDYSKRPEDDISPFSSFQPDVYTLIKIFDEKMQKDNINVNWMNFNDFYSLVANVVEREKKIEEEKKLKEEKEHREKLYPKEFKCDCGNNVKKDFNIMEVNTHDYDEVIIICNKCKKEYYRKKVDK